jgi:regulator of replication initiation timing
MADLTEARLTEISVVLGVLTTEPVKSYAQLNTAQAMWRAFGVSYGAELLAEVDRLREQHGTCVKVVEMLTAENSRLTDRLSLDACNQLTAMDQQMETEDALRAEIADLKASNARLCDTLNFANRYIGELSKRRTR